jgi:hypothetical protein
MKITVKMLRHFTPYVKGELATVDEKEYNRLTRAGAAEAIDNPNLNCEGLEPFKPELTGRNLFGAAYKRGKVDIVIPTPSDKTKTYIPPSRHIESVRTVVRKFTKKVGGFAKACNDGANINEALGEFILFLNDDAQLEAGFFEEALLSFADKDVAIVGNRDSFRDTFINGSIMFVRREIFERIGGFDEQFFFMWEDNDICENILRRGYKMAVSNARGKHKGKRSMNAKTKFWVEHFTNGQNYFMQKWNQKRIIGSMIVGNEENRYMETTIEDLFKRGLIDELVITIDAATDRTEEICRELAQRYPITIHAHKQKLFGTDEAKLRERATEYAISKNAYGIISMDSDEIFDEDVNRFKINEWLESGVAWDFYIAHFWKNTEQVRLDGLFGHQKNIRLFRVDREKPQDYYNTPVHCGSAPIYAYENRRTSDHLFKHYGYASEADVEEKIKRYGKLDPNGVYESQNFYAQFVQTAITAKYNKQDFINNWKT